MVKYDVQTAAYGTFRISRAKSCIEEKGAPIVVKANGLAPGVKVSSLLKRLSKPSSCSQSFGQ